MAGKVIGILLAAVLVVALFSTTNAADDCDSVIVTLSPCLSYIQGGAQVPTEPCCGQLANVVHNHPRCLCLLIKGGGPVPVNVTRALALPGLCKIKTPPVSKCDEAKAPATAPSASATAPSASATAPTSSTPSTPNPSGSSSSGGSSNKSVNSMSLVFLFIAACISSFANL